MLWLCLSGFLLYFAGLRRIRDFHYQLLWLWFGIRVRVWFLGCSFRFGIRVRGSLPGRLLGGSFSY